jgi:hypothetical protein
VERNTRRSVISFGVNISKHEFLNIRFWVNEFVGALLLPFLYLGIYSDPVCHSLRPLTVKNLTNNTEWNQQGLFYNIKEQEGPFRKIKAVPVRRLDVSQKK